MVVLADSGTLAELYGKLTGEPATDAWSRFTAAVGALSVGVTSDDSFGALTKIGTSPTTPGQAAAHWLGRAGAPPLEPFPGSGPVQANKSPVPSPIRSLGHVKPPRPEG
jgi:hypothetical protein